MDRCHQSLPGGVHGASHRKETLTIIGNLAEQHVSLQEQSRHAWKFKHEGFQRAAQEHEQAVRDEVHVAVAHATGMSRAENEERWVLWKIKQSKPGRLIKLRY